MAFKYQALRVPICILQQRAYGTPRRLPALIHPELKKPVVVTYPAVTNGLLHPFERLPYLRKNYYKAGGNFIRCRGCDLIILNEEERRKHYSCDTIINATISRLQDQKLCVICEAPLYDSLVFMQAKYSGVPVCSKDCMCIWNELVPPAFEMGLNLEKLQRKVFGQRHDL